MSVGGSLQEITIAGRTFAATSDADVARKLGGFENTTEPNGNGSARQIKNRVAWMLSGIVVDCDDLNEDHEFLQDIADGNLDVPITALYASGQVYQGTGTINGELQYNNQAGSAQFDLGGPGKLTPQ